MEGFVRQQLVSKQDFEVIVIDDGSAYDVTSLLSPFQADLNLLLLRRDHCGAGAARNAGLELARGPLILLYDDDAEPTPDLIRHCIEFHSKHPAEQDMALLCFEPEITAEQSAFERWAFPRIFGFPPEAGVYDWRFFWTCTLTLKKSIFRYGQFDPAFLMTEDIELGLRLDDAVGIRIYYEPRSYGTFVRRLTLRQICRRQYTIAYFTYRAAKKHKRPADFAWVPFIDPEKYVVNNLESLAAMASIVRSFDQKESSERSVSGVITHLFLTLDNHCLAKGWIAARDGLPVDPVTHLEPLLMDGVQGGPA
jgi:glycosyltransferase involved in cell wall biosynthesis